MNEAKRIVFVLALFFAFSKLSALDLHFTGKELDLDIRGEYNRTFLFSGDLSIKSALELNNRYALRAGIAYGILDDQSEIKAFAATGFKLLPGKPFNLCLNYIFNELSGYDINSHTVLPLISYCGRWIGIAIGVSFRFTSFFAESFVQESILSYSTFVNFVDNKMLRIGIGYSNFDDFQAGNTGAYSLNLNSVVHITELLSLTNVIELIQSGSVALSASFYGIALRGGVQFRW